MLVQSRPDAFKAIIMPNQSRLSCKNTIFFAQEKYTAGFLYTDSRNSARYETTVKQCDRDCISRKKAFFACRIGQVKQSFIA